MKGKILAVLLWSGLMGCASVNDLDPGLEALMGYDKAEAFRIFGVANEINKSKDGLELVWSVDKVEKFWRVRNETRESRGGSSSMQYTVPVYEDVEIPKRCYIRLTADAGGKLVKWERDGNREGCKPYVELLSRYPPISVKGTNP